MKGQNKLFFAIIIALILGVILGGVVHTQYPDSSESFSKNIKLLTILSNKITESDTYNLDIAKCDIKIK